LLELAAGHVVLAEIWIGRVPSTATATGSIANAATATATAATKQLLVSLSILVAQRVIVGRFLQGWLVVVVAEESWLPGCKLVAEIKRMLLLPVHEPAAC